MQSNGKGDGVLICTELTALQQGSPRPHASPGSCLWLWSGIAFPLHRGGARGGEMNWFAQSYVGLETKPIACVLFLLGVGARVPGVYLNHRNAVARAGLAQNSQTFWSKDPFTLKNY